MSSTEYEAARAAHSWAFRRYDEARLAYRARRIGDREFTIAAELYKNATRLFDAAFAAEQARGDESSPPSSTPAQGELFR
jgi:hypothetical protein